MSSLPPPSPRRRASLPLPSAQLLPPKKRWTAWLSPTPAEPAAPVPTATPVVVPQIHAPTATPTADALPSPTLAPPEMDVAASSPAAAGQIHSSSPPPLARDHELQSPTLAADGKLPSGPPPSKRVRKVVRKVRKVVKRLVPKGTTSAAAAAAAAGASQSQAQNDEKKELAAEKVAADRRNAAATPARRSSLLGEDTAAGEADATVAGEPAVEKKKVVSITGEKKVEPVTAVTGRQKRMREVFVGALDLNAREEDVRAALAEAGEITEVRMIVDTETPTKNRGYCFVQYREAEQARKAIAELGGVKICGKECRIQPLEGNGKARVPQRACIEGYTSIYYGQNWPTLDDIFSHYISGNPLAWNGSNACYAKPTSSSGALHHANIGYSPLYHHGSSIYQPDSSYHGLAGQLGRIPMRKASSRKPGHPHRSRH